LTDGVFVFISATSFVFMSAYSFKVGPPDFRGSGLSASQSMGQRLDPKLPSACIACCRHSDTRTLLRHSMTKLRRPLFTNHSCNEFTIGPVLALKLDQAFGMKGFKIVNGKFSTTARRLLVCGSDTLCSRFGERAGKETKYCTHAYG